MKIVRIITASVLFLLSYAASCQYYSTGQDPASIHWRQIITNKFCLIYPENFEIRAQFLAHVMEQVSWYETNTLSANVPRIPVILHNASSISNGVTVWAPKRIEMFPALPPQSYPEDWLEQLAIHEYRHAVQISSVNTGITKILSYLAGEQITGGILGLYLPSWFLEGDATVTETALTKTGRGRSALFESTLRAQLLEKGPYSFDIATLGSYKTFVPDSYSLGYYLVGQTRATFGPEVWKEACSRSGKYPFMVVPFNSGIRKTTRLWKSDLYKKVLHELDSVWSIQDKNVRTSDFRNLTKRDRNNYTDFFQPLYLDENQIIAEISSQDDLRKFCKIDKKSGEISTIITPGPRLENSSSVAENILVWTELRRDKRWQNRSYSEIRLLNLQTGKSRYLTHHSKYFSPSLSADGSRIVATAQGDLNESSLIILDVKTGAIQERISLETGMVAMNPCWTPDSRKIIFTLQGKNGQTLAEWNPGTTGYRTLMPFSMKEINGRSAMIGGSVIFSTQYNGMENLFALDTLTGKIRQVTTSRFAATALSSGKLNGKLLYTDYTSDGAMIAEMEADSSQWLPVEKTEDHSYHLFDILSGQEATNLQDNLRTPGTKSFPSKKYLKITHLFTPHSWAPISFSTENQTANPGVMVLSQNSLSSMFASAGWEYDLNEETGKFYAALSYQGLYPVFDFAFDIGNRTGYYRYSGENPAIQFNWRETNLKLHTSIPWNFSKGRWSRTFQPKIGATLIGVQHVANTPDQFIHGWITSLDYELFFSQNQRMSTKDIYPRLGQTIQIDYRHTPFGSLNMGSIGAVAGRFYFPGIFSHHSFNIYSAWQQEERGNTTLYSYGRFIRLPRGYSGISADQLFSTQVNYAMPLWYPDLSIGSIFYFKRLKMNLFYDYSYGVNNGFDTDYTSTGVEMTIDFHFLRFVAPISCGARLNWFPTEASWNWEFLYSFNLP